MGDIRQVDPHAVKDMLVTKGINHINVLAAGIPCQGFSRANRKHRDDDSRNFLFLEFIRFAEVFTPDYLVIENVGGLRNTADGQFEREIKQHMETLGYSVTVQLVNAADYGVPQLRQRLFFVGVKVGRGLAEFYEFPIGSFALDTYRIVADALSNLPSLGLNEVTTAYATSPQCEYQKLMRGDSATLLNHVAPNHSPAVSAMIANTTPGQPMYSGFKQRVRLDETKPSPTLLAGGIRPQFQFGHPTQARGLTVRECARIQSFPDSYEFVGGLTQGRVLTGNAVPPLLAYELFKPIVDDICKRDAMGAAEIESGDVFQSDLNVLTAACKEIVQLENEFTLNKRASQKEEGNQVLFEEVHMGKGMLLGKALDLLRRNALVFSSVETASVTTAGISSTPSTPKRKVLLLEPNYKNKYPPMGLMKLSTYFKERGDDVRFFKGDLKDLAIELLFEKAWVNHKHDFSLGSLTQDMRAYIKTGKKAILSALVDGGVSDELQGALETARHRFKTNDYPKFDIVGVTTLFTFFWKETVATVNGAKLFVKSHEDGGRLLIGGIASTLKTKKFEEDVGITVDNDGVVDGIFVKVLTNRAGGAPLDEPGLIDEGDTTIIDDLQLDYSLLDETDYEYPTDSKGTAYFGYTTRGCVNRCGFCGVHKLEKEFKRCDGGIKSIVDAVDARYGMQRNLLLLDNNVFASEHFNEIIDEINAAGFGKGNKGYIAPNLYLVAQRLLVEEHNNRAYIKKIIGMYAEVLGKLEGDEKEAFGLELEQRGLVYVYTASREAILDFHDTFAPLYETYIYGTKPKRGVSRSVDFNQGVDARKMTVEIAQKLSEINIRPLRIAFDHWDEDPYNNNVQDKPMREYYEAALRMAYEHGGFRDFSNYMLFNTDNDTPEELYYRLELNAKLLSELGGHISSFPMKYKPLYDPKYFDNRTFIGKHWNKKYLDAIGFILTPSQGVVVSGADYFHFSFGRDEKEFVKILLMPEALIKERLRYDREAHELYLKKTGKTKVSAEVLARDGDTVNKWWNALNALAPEQREIAETIIHNGDFSDEVLDNVLDTGVRAVLEFYRIKYVQTLKKQASTQIANVETESAKFTLTDEQTPVVHTSGAQYKVVDIFAGVGGFSLGFQNAGYKLVAAFEKWDRAADCYEANFDHPVHRIDLSDFEGASKLIQPLEPLIIIGGPPCQDFSDSGKRIEGDRAALTVSFANIVVQVAPRYFVYENVPPAKNSIAYQEARDIFKQAGYGLTEAILDASFYGVPQQRVRFICIGALNAPDGFLSSVLEAAKSLKPMTVRDYFGNSLKTQYYRKHCRNKVRRIVYSIDEPAATVTGTYTRISSKYKQLPGDVVDPRSPLVSEFTYLERSFLQTFPPDFNWEAGRGIRGGTGNIEQFIGNSVPVKLSEAVASALLSYINNQTPVTASASRASCVPAANSSEGSVLKVTTNTEITAQNQRGAGKSAQNTDKTVSITGRNRGNAFGVSVVQQQFEELRRFVFGSSPQRRKAGVV